MTEVSGSTSTVQSPWVCPSDRHLSLRAQLKAGWSVRSAKKPTGLTDAEQEHIKQVLEKANQSGQAEQDRISKLKDRLDNMRRRVTGNGETECMLCGSEFGFLGSRSNAAMCYDCKKFVCLKNCGVDTWNSSYQPIFLCKLCSESREMFKKSGAWFYGAPRYDLAPDSPSWQERSSSRCSPRSSSPVSPRRRLPQVPTNQPPYLPPKPKPRWALEAKSRSYQSKESDDSGSEYERTPLPVRTKAKGALRRCSATDSDRSNSPVSSHVESVPSPSFSNEPADLLTIGHIDGKTTDTSDTKSIDSGVVQSDRSLQTSFTTCRPNSLTTASKEPSVEKDRRVSTSTSQQSVSQPVKTEVIRNSSPDDNLSSSPDDDLSNLGTLEFSLLYDEQSQTLTVNVLRGKKLRAMDSNGFSDPYVKLHLLPGASKATKLRTKTIHKCLDPEWNEKLIYYGVTPADQLKKTIRLTVLDEDPIGHDFLGETRVQLKRLSSGHERKFSVYLEKQLPLEKGDDLVMNERGKILISLTYVSAKSTLVVGVVRCAELLGMDSSGYSDPYVKVQLKPDRKLKYKTVVKKKTLNPEFNTEFGIPVQLADLKVKKTLAVMVYDRDVGKHDDYIGGVELGANAKGERLRHWMDMTKNPDKKFERWHKLTEDPITD